MSEAESDGGEVSGLSDVSWVDSTSEGSLFHGHCTLYKYKFNSFIIIQHYCSSLYLEYQCILIAGKFDPLAVLGIRKASPDGSSVKYMWWSRKYNIFSKLQ